MKKIFFALFISIFLISCKENITETRKGIKPKKTEIELLKERYEFLIEESKLFNGIYENSKYLKHKDDLLNSIKIAESVNIEDTNVFLVFYSFNVGIDIVRKTMYMVNEDGMFYISNKYYSSYDDDPFKNGHSEEGKKILKKAEKWKEENKDINWL